MENQHQIPLHNKISLALLVLVIIVIIIFMFNPFKKSSKYEIVETCDFSCPSMTGFTFKYPVFKGWSSNNTTLKNGTCVIDMIYQTKETSDAALKLAPHVTVEIQQVLIDGFPQNLSKNVNGVEYQKTKSDSILFMISESGIKFSLQELGFGPSFPREQFFKTVIETFKLDERKIDIWNTIENTTFKKDNGWAGEGYVFYRDDNGQKRCIHQTYGSGVHVVSSEYVEVTIIDDKRVKLNNEIYEYRDNTLISSNNLLTLFEKNPQVYNRAGLVDIKIIKSSNFDIKSIEK